MPHKFVHRPQRQSRIAFETLGFNDIGNISVDGSLDWKVFCTRRTGFLGSRCVICLEYFLIIAPPLYKRKRAAWMYFLVTNVAAVRVKRFLHLKVNCKFYMSVHLCIWIVAVLYICRYSCTCFLSFSNISVCFKSCAVLNVLGHKHKRWGFHFQKTVSVWKSNHKSAQKSSCNIREPCLITTSQAFAYLTQASKIHRRNVPKTHYIQSIW